jgi:tetratricopeptide (TPR) repeat protein
MTGLWLKSFWVLLLLTGFGLIACNDSGRGRNAGGSAILTHPPYASLTDSLEKDKVADRSGLYFRRAELLSHNDQHELAAADYSKSWDLRPDELTGMRYAAALTIIGQAGRAIRFLEDCRKKFPANPSFPSQEADLYIQANRMQEAIGLYDDILRTDSLNFDAWKEKGLLLEKEGDTANAIYALKKAYTIAPTNTYGLELALLYADSRDPAALPVCDAILRKDSARDLPDPFLIKGIYYSNIGQYKKAIVQFDSCIGRDWKFADAYLEKGIALFKQKEYHPALGSFQMSVKVSETYADGYFWMGRCYEATGDKQQAIDYYRQALVYDKDFPEAAERIKSLQ